MSDKEITDRLDKILDAHSEFIEKLPGIISSEINKNFVSIGIDPDKKLEFQGSMVFLRNLMKREDIIVSKFWNKITGVGLNTLVVLVMCGLMYLYMDTQFKAMIREEKIHKIIKDKNN